MDNPRSLITVSIVMFALVMGAGALGVLSAFGDGRSAQMAALGDAAFSLPDDVSGLPELPTITARHFFRGGTHIIEGEMVFENSCTELFVTAESFDTTPPFVNLAFTTATDPDDFMCGPTEGGVPFSLSLEGDEEMLIGATLNGEEAVLSLIK